MTANPRYLRRRVRNAERATRTAVAALNTHLNEDLSGTEVIRAFGRQAAFTDRFRHALARWLRAANKSTYYNALYAPALGTLSASATALLLLTGARGTLGAAGITLGTLTAFVLLFTQLFSPLINLGDEWQNVQAALSGAERVFAVLTLPTDHPGDNQPRSSHCRAKPAPPMRRCASRTSPSDITPTARSCTEST